MATIQINVDDNIKAEGDALFYSLGLDTPTAVRMFLFSSIEYRGFPFSVKRVGERKPSAELREAMDDIRLGRNLTGPFATAEEAVRSMTDDRRESG